MGICSLATPALTEGAASAVDLDPLILASLARARELPLRAAASSAAWRSLPPSFDDVVVLPRAGAIGPACASRADRFNVTSPRSVLLVELNEDLSDFSEGNLPDIPIFLSAPKGIVRAQVAAA